jgi:hypothetical protein
VISTVIVIAYKTKGFGASFHSAWSGIFFCLAALLYVDNTDLLHISKDATEPEGQFFHRVQDATSYWARLLQATRGNLKPIKCYWYFMTFKFAEGQALLKPAKELRQYELRIPQPDTRDIAIELKDPAVASEVLGVWSSPSGRDGRHRQHMMEKGHKWASRVMASSLTHAEVWQSFRTQALPAVTYGLVPLMAPRVALDKSFLKWYYSFLPALGVNRKIAQEWRTLPSSFQGLGLPNISLEKLAASLQYIQRHWECQSQ